jgi:hypothetical protein
MKIKALWIHVQTVHPFIDVDCPGYRMVIFAAESECFSTDPLKYLQTAARNPLQYKIKRFPLAGQWFEARRCRHTLHIQIL